MNRTLHTLAVAAALALAAGSASAAIAGPADIQIGDGVGTWTFEGQNVGGNDSSFYVTLAAGTYTFSSDVWSESTAFNNVWLSLSDDPKAHGRNDLRLSPVPGTAHHEYGLDSFTYTFTSDTVVYLNVDARKNKRDFDGWLTITSAVPEPATSALLLAGLGMMAFAGRRRRG